MERFVSFSNNNRLNNRNIDDDSQKKQSITSNIIQYLKKKFNYKNIQNNRSHKEPQ